MMNKIYIVLAAMILFPATVYAVDLTVDQTQILMMPDGKTPKKYCTIIDDLGRLDCGRMVQKTVGDIIQDALTMNLADGRTPDPTNQKSGRVAIRVYGKPTVVLEHDDFGLILARLDKFEDPITIARMHEILEPGPDKKP